MLPDGLTGTELGKSLTAEKPSLKIIYLSGYSSDLMGHGSDLRNVHFLQKPYSAQVLAKTVRDCLDK